MPLLDHFHEPLTKVSGWASFHSHWLTYLADDFQEFLPPRYFAEATTRFGIEVDVAALERMHDPASNGDAADWQPPWAAPAATATVPFAVATDELEVKIYGDTIEGIRLVGAVEVVSPANKDRPENRETFVSKVHGYLTDGVGVVVVDLVTKSHFNLHNDLMDRIDSPASHMSGWTYAVGYRPRGKNGVGELAMWQNALELGQSVPTVPLWLFGGLCIPARLGDTYEKTCRRMRFADRRGEGRQTPTE